MNLLNYILEASLVLATFTFVYWLLLRNETSFSARRIYLLASLIVSACLPFIHFQNQEAQQLLPSLSNALPIHWLPELVVEAGQPAAQSPTSAFLTFDLVRMLYWSVALIFSVAFIFQIARLIQLFWLSEKYKWLNCWVAESEKRKPTFSFFNFIFIGQSHLFTNSEKEVILRHENIHVQKLHSLDILVVNIVKAIAWFHPAVYFIHHELIRLHEFEADEQSVKGKDVDEYCGLLSKVALSEIGYSTGSHFAKSLTIKRIHMMHAMKQNIKNWKIALVGILGMVVAVAIGCQDQVTENRENAINESRLPKDIATQLNRLRLISPKSNFVVMKFNSGAEIDQYEKEHPTAKIPFVTVGTEDYAIIEPNGVFESIPKNENKVFSVVDEAATPVLGINSFFEQLSYTIQYPEKARNNGIEGKVYIGFVVQTDGTVTDAKVIKGLNDEIDTEALRAFYQVNSSWYPAIHQGQIVKMKMVLPIVFSLQSQSHKSGTESSHRMEAAFVFTPNTKSNSQKNSIEGLVQTNDGSPLPGVKVNVKNSTTEVYTDSNGKFTVDTSETNGLLQFFFVGFESLEMKFGSI